MAPALGLGGPEVLGGPSCHGNSNIWGSPGLIYDYSQQHWRFFSLIFFFVLGGFFLKQKSTHPTWTAWQVFLMTIPCWYTAPKSGTRTRGEEFSRHGTVVGALAVWSRFLSSHPGTAPIRGCPRGQEFVSVCVHRPHTCTHMLCGSQENWLSRGPDPVEVFD